MLFRLALVLAVAGILLVLALNLIFGLFFGAILLAIAAYVALTILYSLISILRGACVAQKSQQTFSRRNRTLQFAFLTIIGTIAQSTYHQLTGLLNWFVIGTIGLFCLSFFVTYLSQLAIEGVTFNERLPEEADNDRHIRWALYMPFQFMRDLIIPVFVVILSIYMVYDDTACMGYLVGEKLILALVEVLTAVLPNHATIFLESVKEAFGVLFEQLIQFS